MPLPDRLYTLPVNRGLLLIEVTSFFFALSRAATEHLGGLCRSSKAHGLSRACAPSIHRSPCCASAGKRFYPLSPGKTSDGRSERRANGRSARSCESC